MISRAGSVDGLDDGLQEDDADVALVVVDVDFGLHGGAVLLRQGGVNAVLEQLVQLGALDLLEIRELANRGQYFRRTGHQGLLRFPVEREAGFLHVRRRQCVLISLEVAHEILLVPFRALHRDDLALLRIRRWRRIARSSRSRCARRSDASRRRSSAAAPFPATTLRARTGPATASGIASSRASIARDAFSQSPTLTFSPSRRSMRTSSTGASFAAAEPELDEVKSERVKFSNHNRFQCLLHVDSESLARTKKCGETFPHISPATISDASFSYRIIVGGSSVKRTSSCEASRDESDPDA